MAGSRVCTAPGIAYDSGPVGRCRPRRNVPRRDHASVNRQGSFACRSRQRPVPRAAQGPLRIRGRRADGGAMRSAWRLLGGILVAATALAARAEPGVTATTIVLGQSAAFSGPASELGTEMRAGALAYFQAINAAGGVNGRK